MKQFGLLVLLICIFSHPTLATQSDHNTSEQSKISVAGQFVDLLGERLFSTAVEYFDSTMAAAMPPEVLKGTWEAIQNQVGSYQQRTDSRAEPVQQYLSVFVTCEFELMTLDAKVVIDPDGKVAGLWFLPHTSPVQYEPPSYATLDSFTETEVTIGSGEWELPGTLTMPRGDGPFPAVILVHGSGPQDRNETVGPNRPFCDLAWGLASRGIAVVRYDKRTQVHTARFAAIVESLTVWEETIEDALLAAELVRKTNRLDSRRILILGHSLGGMLIPRIAGHDPNLAGFIVMAGPARPVEEGILEQMKYLYTFDNILTEKEKAQLNRLEVQVGRVKEPVLSLSTPAGDLPLGLPASFWLDLRGYVPPEAALELDRPMLVLQGERDYQVTMTDYLIWKRILAGKESVQFKSYPELNHLFIKGDGRSSPEDYRKPGHVAGQVIEDISTWILSQ
jgi:fermentation-respiration switch protein FrsA (DUF1100 family)